jgi:hypothetical protein
LKVLRGVSYTSKPAVCVPATLKNNRNPIKINSTYEDYFHFYWTQGSERHAFYVKGIHQNMITVSMVYKAAGESAPLFSMIPLSVN